MDRSAAAVDANGDPNARNEPRNDFNSPMETVRRASLRTALRLLCIWAIILFVVINSGFAEYQCISERLSTSIPSMASALNTWEILDECGVNFKNQQRGFNFSKFEYQISDNV